MVGKNKSGSNKINKAKREKKMIFNFEPLHSTESASSASPSDSSPHENISYYSNAESEESTDDQKVDISVLAEQCVLEEVEQFELLQISSKSNSKIRPTHHNLYPLASSMNLNLEFTLEEEFKIHELDAVKENFLDGCFNTIIREFPSVPNFISAALLSLSQGRLPSFSSVTAFSRRKKIKDLLTDSLLNGGSIRKLLDCFTIFKDVQEGVKLETFEFSTVVICLCFR